MPAQSFKPDDVDSGLGRSDDNATANANFSEDKEVEVAKFEGDKNTSKSPLLFATLENEICQRKAKQCLKT